MPIALNQLPDDIDALKSLVADQTTKLADVTARNEQLTTENQHYRTRVLTLQEQLNLALARRYAASSEKISPDQVCMFNEAEAAVDTVPDADDDLISSFRRTHAKSVAASRCRITCPGLMWFMTSLSPSDAVITMAGY